MTTVRGEAPPHDFEAYAAVPIAFQVERALIWTPQLGPLAFREEALASPWLKDYDLEPGAHPTSWPDRFDTARWHVFTAHQATAHVGGLVLILGSAEIEMLEGRTDLALIWDLRVAPEARGSGVGRALLHEAETLALAHGCSELKVETQNINTGACRFYARAGFELRSIDHSAYPGLPDEIQMLWYKSLLNVRVK